MGITKLAMRGRWERRDWPSKPDCRRAIDYQETRGDIDKSHIGVIGHSLGGIETFALTALDSRIRVVVACVTPVGALDRMGDPVRAPRNFARALNGRPSLMQMGRNDPFCNEAQAQGLFDIIPGSKYASTHSSRSISYHFVRS